MWQLIYDNSPWPEKPKLSRNLVSAIHSYLTIALIHFSKHIKYEIVLLNSVSYFIWDLIYMFKVRLQPSFVYHHVVIIWMLLSDLDRELICKLMYYGEVSNILNYVMYHCLQIGMNIMELQIVQTIWFGYFRIYKFTQMFFQLIQNNFLFYNLTVLYFLGIYWNFLQVKKIIL